jgi:hypothetical protein
MRIRKEFLRELSRLVDNFYKNVPENDRIRVTYTIATKKEEKEFSNSAAFIDYGIKKDVNTVRATMLTRTKEIWIRIPFDGGASFDIIAANDNDWIHSVRGQPREILSNYKTRRDFFYRKWEYTFLVCFGLGLISALSAYIGINMLNVATGSPERVSGWFFLLYVFTFPFSWLMFLRWLYPEFETEYTFQARLRKWIWIAITSIILAVIGAYVYEYLPH